MSRTLSDFTISAYKGFTRELENLWAIPESTLKRIGPRLKPLHKKYLALACAATVIGKKVPRNEYVIGLAEASYFSLVLATKGMTNPCNVLLRQGIELLLKHVYFYNHPIEYSWAATREAYKDLTFQSLLEYLRRLDEIRKLKSKKHICDRLEFYYGLLSRYVHVHSRQFMRYGVASSSRKPDQLIAEIGGKIHELWSILIVVLVVCFPNSYLKANQLEKMLIRRGVPSKLRGEMDSYLRAL